MTRLARKDLSLALALAAATAAAGCGKGDGKDGKEGAKAGGAAAGGELPADHVAAVNAAVPADLKGKLEFEAGRVDQGRKSERGYKAAVPKGWKAGGVIPGTLRPADADDFGASKTLGKSLMRIGSNCDGECVKKDWPAIANKVPEPLPPQQD